MQARYAIGIVGAVEPQNRHRKLMAVRVARCAAPGNGLRGRDSTIKFQRLVKAVADHGNDREQVHFAIKRFTSLRIRQRLVDTLELPPLPETARRIIRLRTDQLTRPWQSFRKEVKTSKEWQVLRLPFDAFVAHRTDASFDPANLRRVGILAIGRVFRAELSVASVALYRD